MKDTAVRALIITGAATLLLAVVAAPAAIAAPAGLQVEGAFAGAAVPEPLSARQAADFWTPERLARAKPLDGDGEVSLGSRVPASPLASPQPGALKSTPVNPAGYPNRVHGKIFFRFAGAAAGVYSCSGTIVTSGSGSLINTAAHCVFDFESKSLAADMVFIPGYSYGSIPYSVWPVTNYIVPKRWVKRRNSYDVDFAMARVAPSLLGPIQGLGSRGIGFNQARRQRVQEYGYPAEGRPSYDGNTLIRCDSGYVKELRGYGGPRGRGMHCDSQGGTSGGGWVAQHSFLVSNSSHGYPTVSGNLLFGPYFGKKTKALYKANTAFWPSVGPIKCGGEVASIVGSSANERIRGTGGRDVIATLGGRDRINGRGGKDVICAGQGNDKVRGGKGSDRIDGGQGKDKCGRKRGGNKLHACE